MKSPDSQDNSKDNSHAKLPFRLLRPFLTRKPTDEGTVLVLAVMMGLLFMVLGVVAIAKSGAGKTDSVIGEKAQQSKSIAEAGVNDMMAALNSSSGKSLMLLNYDPNGYLGCTGSSCNQWTDSVTELEISGYNSCGGNTAASRVVTIPVNNSGAPTGEVTMGSGKYKLLGYRFIESSPATTPKSGTGRLYIKGFIPNPSDSTKNDANSTIEVQFPVSVKTGGEGSGSALMAGDIHVAQDDVTANNIICTDTTQCPISCSTGASKPTFAQLAAAIDANNNGADVDALNGNPSNIMVGKITLPDIPKVPTGAKVNQLPNGFNGTLPRAGGLDTPYTSGGVTTYYYQLDTINKDAITVGSTTDTTTQYRLYISGHIDQTGNDDIGINAANGPAAGQVRIYGGKADVDGSNNSVGTVSYPTNPQTWEFGGNSCTTAFIHAPKADIGISGGGNGCSGLSGAASNTNFYGGIWAKSYGVTGNDSNSGIFYEQPGLMAIIATEYPNVGFQNVAGQSVTEWTSKGDPQ